MDQETQGKSESSYYADHPERKELSIQRLQLLINHFCNGNQAQFADKLGLQRSTVNMYLKGKNVLGMRNASKIASAFGVDPEWLRGDETKPDPDLSQSKPTSRLRLAAVVGSEGDKYLIESSDTSVFPFATLFQSIYNISDVITAYLNADVMTQQMVKRILGIDDSSKKGEETPRDIEEDDS